MRVLVLGGSGVAGSAVVGEAAARGHEVWVASRNPQPVPQAAGTRPADLVSGAGLVQAFEGVDAVVDCANAVTLSGRRAARFFVAAVGNAVRAAAAAGTRSYVLPSIVGVDQVPFGYYTGKLAQERTLLDRAGEVPGLHPVVVRLTQFHHFAGQVGARGGLGPLVLVPDARIRPVDVAAAARHLVDQVENGDKRWAPPLCGPRDEQLPDMVRRWARARGLNRRVVAVPVPGRAGRAIREGALIPGEGRVDAVTFDQWLAEVS